VIALNLKRRHLTASQAAAIAVEALGLYEAEAKERQPLAAPSQIRLELTVRDAGLPLPAVGVHLADAKIRKGNVV